jgi:hypothetical protein
VGPLEESSLHVNVPYFMQFRPIMISGQQTLYDTQVKAGE